MISPARMTPSITARLLRLFIGTPGECATGEKEDQRDREKISDHADEESGPQGNAICNGKRDGSTQLNKWHHGDQEGKNVFHEVCLSICLLHSIVSCYN